MGSKSPKRDQPSSSNIKSFLEQAQAQTEDILKLVHDWRQTPSQLNILEQCLQRAQTISHSAEDLSLKTIHQLSASIVYLLELMLENPPPDAYQWLIFSLDELSRLTESLHEGKTPKISDELLQYFQTRQTQAQAVEETRIEDPVVPVDIFHEELTEIMQDIENLILQYRERADEQIGVDAKRHLHTLKGSARLVGFTHLGEFFHELEDLVDQKETSEFIILLERMLELLKTILPKILDQINVKLDIQALEEPLPVIHEPPIKAPLDSPSPSPSDQEEKIRVPLSKLEHFGKLASSTNIARVHIEEQNQIIQFYLQSMINTLNTLEEYSRSLQMRADTYYAQSLKKHRNDMDEYDILELDRYSTLQQYARDIHDLSTNLFGVHENINESAHDLEERLREQKYATQRLETSLTHVRMVSFESIVPRLESIVTQIAQELQKDVQLKIVQIQGEMDRSVLQKLITPLEHMLRNAIDHGIESSKIRTDLGKTPFGLIEVSLVRQGAHVIITMKDDGSGIDLKKLKQMAIERGFWDKERSGDPQSLLNLIFLPGFSTSESLSTISGRGIGMDIVRHEIRKLGGHLHVQTVVDQGTTFTIKLPFTSSLNQALIFQSGFQLFGLLVSNITGITRFSVDKLHTLYGTQKSFEYMGKNFKLMYIGEILQNADFMSHQFLEKSLPVILLEVNQKRIGIIIDKVIGAKEVLVKTLGLQMQSVQELLGASVLGDGRIVLILDPQALVHEQPTFDIDPLSENEQTEVPCVMVVDDSSTVRKVTAHLLEREGFRCVSAKDGEDALTLIESNTPDCILLDLEMPRLDGFGFLEALKKSKKSDIPVIVISSRSMEKYKKRAFQLGAKDFLSKPFQNETLLETLEQQIRRRRDRRN